MFLNKAVLIYFKSNLSTPSISFSAGISVSFLEMFMIVIKQSYLLLNQIIHGSYMLQWNEGKTTYPLVDRTQLELYKAS